MVVQHNISAMTANRYYGVNNSSLAKSLEKLASGYAINRAGDNAAGLAVSEKMRAQIGGLTQASKNAEDGISLVQTMEGALQETDSILQRMRTLAVQSANGSYQDDVDREAMQLEFDQLNDELNQIADTDFNGVVMLNGGEMADGLKVDANNKFDYANKAGDVIAKAQDKAQEAFQKADADLTAAKTKFNKTNYDLSENGTAAEWNTLDNNSYDKNAADDLWIQMGITKADGSANTANIKNVTVTFEYDGEGGWKAIGGVDEMGHDVAGAKDLTLTSYSDGVDGAAEATGHGGFSVMHSNGTDEIVNAVFDVTKAKKGDTATIKFTNDSVDVYAPENIGLNQDSVKLSEGAEGMDAETLSVSFDTTPVVDDKMSQAIADAYKALENAEISVNYVKHEEAVPAYYTYDGNNTAATAALAGVTNLNAGGALVGKITGITEDTVVFAEDDANYATINAADGTHLNKVKDAEAEIPGRVEITIKGAGDEEATTLVNEVGTKGTALAATDPDYTAVAATSLTIKGEDGKAVTLTVDVDKTNGEISFKAKDKDNTDATIMKIGAAGIKTGDFDEDTLDKNGTLSGSVSVSASAYKIGSNIKATPDDNPDLGTSTTVRKELDAAQAAYDKAVEDMNGITDIESANAYLGQTGVSKSDAFDQSRSTLTYADSMSLQVGARTKDLVNFTFGYQSNGLGELKANLNCSARTDGLGTADLSIATQKGANDAIDKIDNALNKISMVRATFGAAQNRLEHKINNIDTNTENLTAAESRIRDTQMDKEMMKFTSAQILSQASQSMLAQANQLPQGVLQLLG